VNLDPAANRPRASHRGVAAAVLSRAGFRAVDHHRPGERLADHLTVLVLSRPIVPPVAPLIPAP
jgi:hypothetical protein